MALVTFHAGSQKFIEQLTRRKAGASKEAANDYKVIFNRFVMTLVKQLIVYLSLGLPHRVIFGPRLKNSTSPLMFLLVIFNLFF